MSSSFLSSQIQPYGLRDILYSIHQYLHPDNFSYWIFVFLSFFVLSILSFCGGKKINFFHGVVYYILIFQFIFFAKWPDLFRFELNPDESFSIAGGMSLSVDPVYWRSFTGSTHGPLIHYPMVLPRIFGLNIDYASARWIGIMLFSGTFFFLAKIFALFFKPNIAKVAVLPGILVYAFSHTWDFAAYNGEHVCVFLLTLSLYFALAIYKSEIDKVDRACCILGLILGTVPFSKIQAVPAGGAIGLLGILAVFLKYKKIDYRTLMSIGLIFLGSLVVPFLFISITYLSGAISEFWISYILQNFSYANTNQACIWDKVSGYFDVIFQTPNEISEFIISQSIFIFLALVLVVATRRFWHHRLLVITFVIYLFINVYTVSAAGNIFKHYALFLISPFVLISGTLFAILVQSFPSKTFTALVYSFYIGCCVVFAGIRISNASPVDVPAELPSSLNESLTARLIRTISIEADSMVVWGWLDFLYPQTAVYSGTRYSSIFLLATPNPYSPYFINQYVEDLENSKSPLFVDAVGPNHFRYYDRDVYGHEKFVDVKSVIDKDYVFLFDIESNRIYLKRDRWKEIKQTLNLLEEFPVHVANALKVSDIKAYDEFQSLLLKREIKRNYFSNTKGLLEDLVTMNIISRGLFDSIIASAIVSVKETYSVK